MPSSFLDTRRQLITLMVRLSQSIDAGHDDVAAVLVIRLCDHLVDYLSVGHFSVYGETAVERDTGTRIDRTTDCAMRFNDRFGEIGRYDRDAVRGALETLALAMETRFELEDSFLVAPAAG